MEETVGFALAQTCKAHRAYVDAVLRDMGLHIGQEMILNQLWQNEGLTQSQLGERICSEPPTITKMLRRLEQEDLLQRRPDADDARVSRVFLTERGRALQQRIEQAWAEVERRAVAGLSVEERVLLRRLLLHVRQNLS